MLSLRRPQWKASLFPQVVSEGAVLVVDESEHFLLSGSAFPHLVPLLDGRRTAVELLNALEGKVPPFEIMMALYQLERRGCIVEADDAPVATAAFWHEVGLASATGEDRLAGARVALHALGEVVTAPLGAALADLGVTLVDPAADADPDLDVVLVDDYLHPDLPALNARMLAAGRPWLIVKPRGKLLWLGPHFRPGEPGCWRCLAQRLRLNRQVEGFVERRATAGGNGHLPLSRAAFSTHANAAYALAAGEIVRALTTGRSALDGAVVTLHTLKLESERHQLIARPQCPACGAGDWPGKGRREVHLKSGTHPFPTDGGFRVEAPDLTWERLRHHVSPITGVVTSLVRFDEQAGSGLTYSYSAGHNFAMMQDDLYHLMMNLRSRSGGKGTTDMSAKVSAVCEAIERYSGVWRDESETRRGSFAALGDEALHPNDILLFSADQYGEREAWNRAHPSPFHQVPRPFDETLEIDWTPVWSLLHKRFRWVPSAYCWFGHPDLTRAFFCSSDANGNATGNTLEEAILQGFLELVERDAVACWWYNRVRRPAVDLESFGEPYVAALLAHYRTIGREIWMLDLTHDLGIPAFAGVSRALDRPTEDIVLGFGAHLDPRIALLRTLTEVNQFLPSVTARNEDGSTDYWFRDPEAIEWWRTATVESEPYVLPDPDAPVRRASDFPRHSTGDLGRDVERCVELAAAQGLETLVLDQTQPDIGQPVVKVIVPGLRHFWKRFGPGRLFDVPVRLGWLDAPRAEEALNPTGIFF